jgi:hypothetical protein
MQNEDSLQQQFAAAMQLARLFCHLSYFHKTKTRAVSLLDGAPTGCQDSCTDKGWINWETSLQRLQFFVEQFRPNSASKVLLVLDNHESYNYIKVLDHGTENNVLFLSFARFRNSLYRGTQGKVTKYPFSFLLLYLSLGMLVWSINMLIEK